MARQTDIPAYHVLIAAAGKGKRFGEDIPKQYCRIHGKMLLRHTLDNVMSWPSLASVRVIIDPEHADLYHEAVKGLDLPEFTTGGRDRKSSINNGLNSFINIKDEEIVLIHDAARPFARFRDIERLLQALNENRAATLAVPVSDTLRKGQDVVEREGLWALQTPQAFYFQDIQKAHQGAANDAEYTDDTGLISAMGIKVQMVEGASSNIKITTPEDMVMGAALLANQTETRTAQGYDVHAFDKDSPDKPLMLCGIKIEHDYPLKGHSDADVGLHALTDALLGTMGAGDIGEHFPPSDPAFKDMDSRVFLEKAVEMLEDKGGCIQNLDLTLICEEPKITPHREVMRGKIAEIARIDIDRVSVKATTTEKLGFTGRGEGIAAQAIATIKVPLCP